MPKKITGFTPVIAAIILFWHFSIVEAMAACTPTALGCVSYDVNGFSSWFLKIAFGIAGGIAFLLMIYGFILLGTSKGDPKKTQGAKETITSAIIGLLVTIFSVFLYRFLTINVLNIPLTSNPTITSSGSSSGSSSSSSSGSSTSGSSSGTSSGSSSSGSSSSGSSSSSSGAATDDGQDSSGDYNGSAGGYSGGYYQESGMFASAHEVLAPISSMAAVSPPTKVIPCHGDMTQYQNELMSKINSVGYKTRNAVVVAANYLATQFPYRVPYHWGGGHNSSIDLDGGFLASGNGQYTTNWGCPSGVNGLDCSGFVNWAYLTAGFKAVEGNKEYRWNKGNFERVDISRGNCDYIKSRIKPGDVLQNAVGETAHTALVLAYDNDDTVKYVDESGTVGISFMDICTGKRSCKGCGGFERISFMDVYFDKYAIKY